MNAKKTPIAQISTICRRLIAPTNLRGEKGFTKRRTSKKEFPDKNFYQFFAGRIARQQT